MHYSTGLILKSKNDIIPLYSGAEAMESLNAHISSPSAGLQTVVKVISESEVILGDVIGEGSFGIVRSGKWRGMNVAIKALKGIKPSTLKSDLEELIDEACTMSRVCHHSNIVQFIGVLRNPTTSLVTVYYEYGSLENALLKKTKKPLHGVDINDNITLLRFALEASIGVQHLHCEHVIHRDLACRNLLLDENLHIRVCDFGFARFKDIGISQGYSQTDLGPIRWSAPEAIRKKAYSEFSDVFSFGVVLYEIFYQALPWSAYDTMDVAIRVCSGERMNLQLESRKREVPDSISSLMIRCWSHEPQERLAMVDVVNILQLLYQEGRELQSLSASQKEAEMLKTGISGCYEQSMCSDNTLSTLTASMYDSMSLSSDGPIDYTINTNSAQKWDSSSHAECAQANLIDLEYLLSPTTSTSVPASASTNSISNVDNHDNKNCLLYFDEDASLGSANSSSNNGTDKSNTTRYLTIPILLSDKDFYDKFMSFQLQGYGHESLLRFIYISLQLLGRSSKSVDTILDNIKRYEKDDFHMTINYFWIQLITYKISLCKHDLSTTSVFDIDNNNFQSLSCTFEEFMNHSYCHELYDKLLYMRYYSRRVIETGKKYFCLPDILPLPSIMK